jgi:hypothetical protein
MFKNFLLASVFLISQSTTSIEMNSEFLSLKHKLEDYGFEVILKTSPIRGSYGLLNPESKQIWIDPIVFQLGISKPTLIHEAVHATQYCFGNGKMQALGLTISPPNITRRFFMRYKNPHTRHLEAEAYAVQTQPNALELVMSLLSEHC